MWSVVNRDEERGNYPAVKNVFRAQGKREDNYSYDKQLTEKLDIREERLLLVYV